jgi:hypothetical protein
MAPFCLGIIFTSSLPFSKNNGKTFSKFSGFLSRKLQNGGNGLNGVDGAAAGTHGNGENGKRIGPRLAIEESGEGTRSTNGGNEDQIESRVDFLSDTSKLRSTHRQPDRNVKQAGKIIYKHIRSLMNHNRQN